MNQNPPTGDRAKPLTLTEAASLLGVHYMTAYRYIRRGQLHAKKVGSHWQVLPEDLDRFRSPRDAKGEPGARIGVSVWSQRYENRLLAADQTGAWGVIDDARASGLTPTETYLGVIAPALVRIGAAWERQALGIAAEHVASVIVGQHLGRLSPAFASRGRRRGSVLLGCPPGEHHHLGLNMVADLFTAAGFNAVNLGANTPASAFSEALEANDEVAAIGISSHAPDGTTATRRLIRDLRLIAPDTPLLVGGTIATQTTAAELGADHATDDIATAIDWVTRSHRP